MHRTVSQWLVASMLFLSAPLALADSESARLESARHLLSNGQGQPALRKLLPLARRGDAEAAYLLGRLYYYDEAGVRRDWRKSAYWFAKAAAAGHAGAQYKLGGMYYTGRGVAQDLDKAILWWTQAAHQMHPEALNNLGALIRVGAGVKLDQDLGFALQILAAELGSETARLNVSNKPANDVASALANEFALNHARLVEALQAHLEPR